MLKVVFCLALALGLAAAQSPDPLAIYKTGDYVSALPLLQQAVAKNPKDAPAQAALLSVLTYLGKADEAADAADDDATNFPQSSDVVAARGEFAFYMGDMPGALKLFQAAVKLNENNARAIYGLHRFQLAASNYRSARLLCLKAHELDPDDALISLSFSRYLVGEKRREFLPEFIKTHPWFYNHLQEMQQTSADLRDELNERKPFELDGPREEVTVPLFLLHDGPRVVGVGIHLTVADGKKLNLVLDTGAAGILLSQAAIDKAGLSHIGSTQIYGVGDKGARNAFLSVADTCSVGNLRFKTCIFGATEGKKRVIDAEDGLFGTNVFQDYIVTIDFQRLTLHLVPLPERPPNPQGYDRDPLPTETGFTPIYRFGHRMEVSTKVNNKETGLFLIDTGSVITFIDSTFARLSTKIHGNEYMTVRGVSGAVKDVFEADKADIQFARFHQPNFGLTSINLNNDYGGHSETRIDGILGFQLLVLFHLTLDYRNGLVNFDYVLDRKK